MRQTSAHYNYSTFKKILNVKIDNKLVWKKRIQLQSQFIHLLEDAFASEITTQAFGFYPGNIYFSTPLTTDKAYAKKALPLWEKISKAAVKHGWDVYKPYGMSNPHAKVPDNFTSYHIRDMDHVRVLTAEVALFDLNRPSHGVGQEIEMSVFMPSIGFSKERVSRLVKGMPGMLVINYGKDEELVKIINEIFERKSYGKQPFYLDSCPRHATMSIHKGKACLHCEYQDRLHQI